MRNTHYQELHVHSAIKVQLLLKSELWSDIKDFQEAFTKEHIPHNEWIGKTLYTINYIKGVTQSDMPHNIHYTDSQY